MFNRWKGKDFLFLALFLQIAMCIVIFFDVPVARQAIGFVYFTFLPGYLIVKLLKLQELDGLETILLSLGLSVAFLMLAGFFINEFGSLLGVSRPLSFMPLMIGLNGLTLALAVLVSWRSDAMPFRSWTGGTSSWLSLVLVFLPILAVLGATWVNLFGNNVLLLLMLMAICLLFVVGVVSRRLLPPRFYPFALLAIAISLLYHSALVSSYIFPFGSDVPVEYFVFKTTQNTAFWSPSLLFYGDVVYGRIHSMLSVSILPTAYSNLLNMDPAWIFKIVFPLIFSFLPLGLYQIWKGYVGEKYAFISSFVFVSFATFYTEMLGLNRQMIAELFFVLTLLVILNKKMRQVGKIMCAAILTFGLVTSHYGLSEIFLFFALAAFLFLFIMKRPSRNITVSLVVFLFVIAFAWYIYTSGSAVFDSFLEYGNYVVSQLGEFFNPASRGQTVLRGLGLESPPSIWNAVGRGFAYVTQFLIVVGFIGLITRRTKIHFERDYFVLSSIAMVFLIALILVPGLASTMNITRFYHVLLFYLAPACVIGAVFLFRLVSKKEREFVFSILIIAILVPYFLFQTGFVYEVTGSDNFSVSLSKYRMDDLRLYGHFGYVDAFSASCAQWLSRGFDVQSSRLYADTTSKNYVLSIYGMLYRGYINELSNITIITTNGTFYLNKFNVDNKEVIYGGHLWNYSELSFSFNDLNLVYANGGSEVYKNVP